MDRLRSALDRGVPDANSAEVAWLAKVSKAPGSLTARMSVTVDSMGKQQFNRCRWMPRGEDLPAKGDRALVVLDELGDAWVIAWWPA